MPDQDLVTKADLTNVDEVEIMVREVAQMICAEQPDMPEPQSLEDLDSFSVVQLLLEVENTTGRKLLEKFEGFAEGEQFRDLASHIVKIVAEEDAEAAAADGTATADKTGQDEGVVAGPVDEATKNKTPENKTPESKTAESTTAEGTSA